MLRPSAFSPHSLRGNIAMSKNEKTSSRVGSIAAKGIKNPGP